jgi:hypothetical protein
MELLINYACTHAWSGKREKTLGNYCIPFNTSACYGATPDKTAILKTDRYLHRSSASSDIYSLHRGGE